MNFTFTEDDQEWGASQHIVKLLDDPSMENMMVVTCRWMHVGKEVCLGPQSYNLYEELGHHAWKLLMNTQE